MKMSLGKKENLLLLKFSSFARLCKREDSPSFCFESRGSVMAAAPPEVGVDPFPLRLHKFFFAFPKATESCPQLAPEMRDWVTKTYGTASARDCDSAISEIAKTRETLVQLSKIDCTAPECQATFHTQFDALFAPQCFTYIRTLSEFVEKTRGTSAARGLKNLEFTWNHWLSKDVAKPAETGSLNFELYSAIWCLAAGYSIYATILPANLKASIRSNPDVQGHNETIECLQHRSRNFMRSAMIFDRLERTINRIGFIVDEFHPQVCRILKLVMLAQAQECCYFGQKLKEQSVTQRPEHAAMAYAAVIYYRDALDAYCQLPEYDKKMSAQSTAPSRQIPAHLFSHCYSSGIMLRISMISHLMEIDKKDSLKHGKQIGNCDRIITIIQTYLERIAPMNIDDEHSFAPQIIRVLEEHRTLAAILRRQNEKMYGNEIVWDLDRLEKADPEPIDQVNLAFINMPSVSEGLRQVYFEIRPNKFSSILSLESLKIWIEYRKKRCQQYGLHMREFSAFRTLIVNTLGAPSAVFPLLYLYFVAHSLGISGETKTPLRTPLGAKAAAVIQGSAGWASFQSLMASLPDTDKSALQLASELELNVVKLRTFVTRMDPTELANFALDTPIDRCNLLVDEQKVYRSPLLPPALFEAVSSFRKTDSFLDQVCNSIAIPRGFWIQICDSKSRAPEVDGKPSPLSTSFMPPSDDISEMLEKDDIEYQKNNAARALSSSTAPSKGFLGALFSSGTGVDEKPIKAQPTQFSSANPNLITAKMMTHVVRLVDDIYLPLEELQDGLINRMIDDIKIHTTEIPQEEAAQDYVVSKLAWLKEFALGTHDLIETGKKLVADLIKLDPGKDIICDELRTNFGYSSAGGPSAGISCTFLEMLTEVMGSMRGCRLANQALTQMISEGTLVKSQCTDIMSSKAANGTSIARSGAPPRRQSPPPPQEYRPKEILVGSSSRDRHYTTGMTRRRDNNGPLI